MAEKWGRLDVAVGALCFAVLYAVIVYAGYLVR